MTARQPADRRLLTADCRLLTADCYPRNSASVMRATRTMA